MPFTPAPHDRSEPEASTTAGIPLQIPHPLPVEEARDDAVLADLQDRAELAGGQRGGGAGAFDDGGGRGGVRAEQGMGVVAEDGAEGQQPAAGSVTRAPSRPARASSTAVSRSVTEAPLAR